MRDPSEWKEADLTELIRDDVQESQHLDYKQSDALARNDKRRNEISKDVAAFANSDGGRIVYGIVEKDHHPVRIDDGVDATELSREWLEQVISSTIQPKIDGLRIYPIGLPSKGPNRVSYVIEIPQSKSRAPHQSHDNKYYKRYNFQSVAMQDYEIRDVMRRASIPDLWIKFVLGDKGEAQLDFLGTGDPSLPFTVIIENRSSTPAEYALITLYFDAHLNPLHMPLLSRQPNATRDGTEFMVFEYRWSLALNHIPIFAEAPVPLPPQRALSVPRDYRVGGILHFGYEIRCPGFSNIKFVKAVVQNSRMWIPEQKSILC